MINTGKAPLSATALAAILSLSLVVNLPGLAITPMLGSLSEVFPHTSQLEKQLLTTLPNVLIIPFVLLGGKLSLSRHKIGIVVSGIVIYLTCAVAYMLCNTMTGLIIVSALMGVGAGMLVPFSTGLLADCFDGKHLVRQMGLQSGISNLTLVVATFAVGWLSHGNWHLPFLVYLVTLIPLAFSPFLRRIPTSDLVDQSLPSPATSSQDAPVTKTASQAAVNATSVIKSADGKIVKFGKNGFSIPRTAGLFAAYFFITFISIIVSLYCPFLVEKYHWSDTLTGNVSAVFFLFVFLPGFTLPFICRHFRNATLPICLIAESIGLALFAFVEAQWALYVGGILVGFSYGTIQPLIYNKATEIVNTPRKSTLALAVILSANYLSIVLTPLMVDALRPVFDPAGHGNFAFVLTFILALLFLGAVLIWRRGFVFAIPKSYYK